jgi:hypothetical protein
VRHDDSPVARDRAIVFYLTWIIISMSFNRMLLIEIRAVVIAWSPPEERSEEMRRSWIVVTLICFIFSGALIAFGGEQKVEEETYQKQAEKTLKGFAQKMEEMKGTAAELKMESKEKFDQEMKVLKQKKEAADKKLEDLKSATAENWDKMKAEMENTMDELKKQYDAMKSHFRKE